MAQTEEVAVEFSLVRGDALFRMQRALGLIPAQGVGVVRRAVLAVLVTWAPLVVAAAAANRLWPGAIDEPLLQHFGVHVRFLLAVPLFIIDDAVAHRVFGEIFPHFVRSGLVTYIARPIFVTLLLVWLWRLTLTTALLWRISRLDLALVPTHADRAGGLGFLEVVPLAFVAPAFAIASVLSGRWAHDSFYHGVPLGTLTVPVAAFVGVTALVLLVPLLVFARPLWAARRRALFDYGGLVGEHHRRRRRRWILGEALGDDAMLHAPELGSVADSVRLYDAVWHLWPLPISKRMLLAIATLIALPMLPLVALEVHLGDALMKIVRTLL